VIAELARRLSGTLGPTAKASTAIRTLAVKLGPCDAQVCGTFKSCKSYFNRTKLQRNLNNIGVRSFILTGAPLSTRLRTPRIAMLAREHSLFEQVLIAVDPHLVVINLDDLDKRLKVCLSERHRTRGEPIAAHLKSCGIWEKCGRAVEKNSKQISESASELSAEMAISITLCGHPTLQVMGLPSTLQVTGPCSHLMLQVTVSHS
jgi:hypothetical protein